MPNLLRRMLSDVVRGTGSSHLSFNSRRELKVESLESRKLLAVSVVWNPGTSDLAINGDDTANTITVSTEAISGTVYPVVDFGGGTVWHGSALSPTPVTAADVETMTVAPGKKADQVDLSGVSLSAGFTGMVAARPVTVVLGADGGEGNDTITGSQFGDDIDGGKGKDYIDGQGGDDWIAGGDGAEGGLDGNDDVIIGGTGNDIIASGEGDDRIDGGMGDDLIGGENGNDVIFGGAGDDVLLGFDGDDALFGGGGDDELWGSTGGDTLFGDGGDDLLAGEDGDDRYVFRFFPGDMSMLGIAVATRDGDDFELASELEWDLGDDDIIENTSQGTDTLDYSDFRGAYSAPTLPANVESLIAPPSSFSPTNIQGLLIDSASIPNKVVFTTLGGGALAVGIYRDVDGNGLFDPNIDSLLASQEASLTITDPVTSDVGTVDAVGHRIEVDSSAIPRGPQTFFAVSLDETDAPVGEPFPGFHLFPVIPLDGPLGDAVFVRQDEVLIDGRVGGYTSTWAPLIEAGFAAVSDPMSSVNAIGGGAAVTDTNHHIGAFGSFGTSDSQILGNFNGVATDLTQSVFNVGGLIQAGYQGQTIDTLSSTAHQTFAGGDVHGLVTNDFEASPGLWTQEWHEWTVEERFPGEPTPETVNVLFDLQSIASAAFNHSAPRSSTDLSGAGYADDYFRFSLRIGSSLLDSTEIIALERNWNSANGNQINVNPITGLSEFRLLGTPIDFSGVGPDPFVRPMIQLPLEIGDHIYVSYRSEGDIDGEARGRGTFPQAQSMGAMGTLFNLNAIIVGTS